MTDKSQDPGIDQKKLATSLRIGWLADLEALLSHPECLIELRDRLGITTLWLESGRYHTAGYALSRHVKKKSPFQGWRTRPGLARHRFWRGLPEDAFPVLPGILPGADDQALLTVLQVAKDAGVEVWGHMGMWSYAASLYPEYALRGLDGENIPEREERWGDGFCPSQECINAWVGDCLEDVLSRYVMDGIQVDHARYPPPASLPNLFTCTCTACQRQAAQAGEDLVELTTLLKTGWARLKGSPAQEIMTALNEADNLLAAMDTLLPNHAATRWFRLRCELIARPLYMLANRITNVAGQSFLFGIDVFPPSIAFLGGHDYAKLEILDYITGGFGMIGWEKSAALACASWSAFLLQCWPELDEASLLHQLFRLLGLQDIGLPVSASELENLPVEAMVRLQEKEMVTFPERNPRVKPVYPPINLNTLKVKGAQEAIAASAACGLSGIMLAGLESLSLNQLQELSNATCLYW